MVGTYHVSIYSNLVSCFEGELQVWIWVGRVFLGNIVIHCHHFLLCICGKVGGRGREREGGKEGEEERKGKRGRERGRGREGGEEREGKRGRGREGEEERKG